MSIARAVERFRPAGERLIRFAQSPMGEEVAEGVTAGGLVGLGLLASGQPIEQTATQTALAMAGGIGLGMGGRRIGAAIGKRIHPEAYTNQGSLISGFSRMGGQEGLFSGISDSMTKGFGELRGYLRKNTMDEIHGAFIDNPVEVARKFGVTPDEFEGLLSKLRKADDIVTNAAVEYGETGAAAALRRGGENMRKNGIDDSVTEAVHDFQNGLANIIDSTPVTITGEHTGRALGRAFGDELGVGLGLGAGALIGQQAGWESEKDREIRLLREQLGQ